MLRTFCLLALVAGLFTAAVAQVSLTKTPPQFLLPYAKTVPVIDGKLTDWDMANTPYTISPDGKNPLNEVMNNDATNPVKGDADFSGRVALAWDETCLYVAAQMTDDSLVGVKPDSAGNQGPAGWFVDSLMVSIASYRQPMKTNSPFSANPFLGLRYAPMGQNPRGSLLPDPQKNILDKRDLYWILTQGSMWSVAETPNGYNVEAAIPWADFNFAARPGEKLFIAFLAADVDTNNGKLDALVQIGWGFKGDPKQHPVFRLAKDDAMLGLLTVSADKVPADTPWALRMELDAGKTVTHMRQVRVVDADDKTVYQQPLTVDAQPGMTATAIQEVKAGAVPKPGKYTAELLAAEAGAPRVVARVPVEVIAAADAAPLIKNGPGELRHYPPDRIAHNAVQEIREGFFKHNFVGKKDDYIPFIRHHVEPGLKEKCRGMLDRKDPWGYGYAFHCMSLYKITKDEEYVSLARGIMDYTLDQDWGWFKLTSILMYRYMTWMQDPNSPFAPKDAEKRLRAFLYKVAANPDEALKGIYPNNGTFAEWGTHNRVWHRYEMLKIARMVAEQDKQPIDKRVIEFTDYHDKLIGEVGDADDASAGYHWVFFDAALGLYLFTGDLKAFANHPGYRKTLSRYVEMISPSGGAPQFGSCNGWQMVGSSMWAYEMMSALTGDGRFRWTSHRLAEYYYNHLDYRANQYHLPYDESRNSFTLAYLWADDAVAPKPPVATSHVTWRHPMIPVSVDERKLHPQWFQRMDATRWIPDKLVLSSGNDPMGLWGLVELLPVGGHTGELPGNLIALMQHDAVLLCGQGYYEMTPDFNNLLWVEDLDGLAAAPQEMTTSIPIFVEDPAFTFVRIVTEPYQHLPITYTRDLLFYKNGFVLIKDRAQFHSAMKVRLGPCVQTRELGPQSGENWFNTYYDQLYYTGLGLGRGVQALQNPNWDLLVFFSPRNTHKQAVVDRYQENPYRVSPVQLRQSWSGLARDGMEVSFTTVLYPHPPTQLPNDLLNPTADSKLPKRVQVVEDTNGLTVVKVFNEPQPTWDPTKPLLYETCIMLNTTGKLAIAGPMESDALLAVVSHNLDGTLQHRAIAGGTVLRYKDADLTGQARKYQLTPLTPPAEYTNK